MKNTIKLIILLLFLLPQSATHSEPMDTDIVKTILTDNPDYYKWDKQTREIVRELYKEPYGKSKLRVQP